MTEGHRARPTNSWRISGIEWGRLEKFSPGQRQGKISGTFPDFSLEQVYDLVRGFQGGDLFSLIFTRKTGA
ncbi:hypothetical protein GWI33_011237 [Rhynchophorus ferrugineus]|uniref:Uncharacterized protein n=1 Tax=Rhynchophorus ferrugineus TaxID=354439 RepID=A0A834MBQ1_RHYFE|nr:hypothetical protein GWI33_011237 [Rhynchophorus ferrugineus]